MIRDRIVNPLVRAICTPINRAHEQNGFNPLSLFSAGEQGCWYDPSDMSSMFQDAAGTIPVTAAGQPVGLVRDKSGNNNHLTSSGGQRPILNVNGPVWYLEYGGVTTYQVTGSINFTGTSSMSIFVGMGKFNDAAARLLLELSSDIAANNGSFALLAPDAAAPTFRSQFKGTIQSDVLASGYPTGQQYVLTAQCTIGVSQSLRVNKTVIAGDALQGTGNFGNYPLNVGMRAGLSLPFRGYLCGLIIRGAVSDAAAIASTESYLAGKSGVVL